MTLVECCLYQLELDIDAIEKVVSNNHHHCILTYMEHHKDVVGGSGGGVGAMEWQDGLNINAGSESGYTDEENLLTKASHKELSHHLAHAYSAAT